MSANEVQASITPTDATQELLKSDSKDRQLYKFAKAFQKQDYYDRNHLKANVSYYASYLFSCGSIGLSIAYLDTHLLSDIPFDYVRYSIIIGILLLVEFIKHTSLHTGFKSYFVYDTKPVFTSFLFVGTAALSLYLCINGTSELNRQSYIPPQVTDFVTHYDTKITALEQKNQTIFNRNKWKGKLNAHSEAGKAYAANEALITDFKAKAEQERQKMYDTALTEYDTKHRKKSIIRQFVGYFVEASILFCVLYYLVFCYYSQLEHTLRLNEKYSLTLPNFITNSSPPLSVATAEHASPIGFNANEGNSIKIDANIKNDKSNMYFENLDAKDLKALAASYKRDLNAYRYKLDNGKGTATNNKNKIAYFEERLEKIYTLQKQMGKH